MENIDNNHFSDKLIKESFADPDSLRKHKQMEVSIHPVNLDYIEIQNKLVDPNVDGFLKGFTIIDNEGIRCDDKEIVAKQSGIFSDVVKQLTTNMLKGYSITSLSLPIKIFEPKTQLERNIAWWSFAPKFLKEAGKCFDPIETLKLVTKFVLSALFLSTEQLKPFNPYLGETFQAVFEDGSQVYLEHTSHTPCISNYYLTDIDKNYDFSGYFELTTEGAIKMVLNNQLIVLNKGKAKVHLKETQNDLFIQFPSISVGGLVYGQRVVGWRNMLKIEDHKNNLIVLVYFNKSVNSIKKKRAHDFTGGIYSHDFSKEHKKDKHHHEYFYEEKVKKEPEDKYKLISIEGSYLEELYFNGKQDYDFRIHSPYKFHPYFPNNSDNSISKYSNTNHLILPSDSRYREDLIWLKRAFLNNDKFNDYSALSGKWKLILEAQQRIDRENRHAIKEAKKHHKVHNDEEEKPKKKGIMSSINSYFKKNK